MVVRYGPEPAPDEPGIYPPPESPQYTAMVTGSALWWPGHGDLTIAYDNATHGGVLLAVMDGTEIDVSAYKVDDGKIILTDAFLKSLGFGEHDLVLTTEHGGHTVKFRTEQAKDGDEKKTDQKIPVTGDGQNGLLWTLLALAALAGIIMTMIILRKRRKQ